MWANHYTNTLRSLFVSVPYVTFLPLTVSLIIAISDFRHIRFHKHIILKEVYFFQNLLPLITVGSCNNLRGDGVAPHVRVPAMFLFMTVVNKKGRRSGGHQWHKVPITVHENPSPC
jgi:hypothetical protein